MDRSGVTVKEITPSIATLATHFPDSFSADPADRLEPGMEGSMASPLR